MEFNQIRYFLNLADTLNFTEAAMRSGVSQPTLTCAMRPVTSAICVKCRCLRVSCHREDIAGGTP
jgi:hypothetical protein